MSTDAWSATLHLPRTALPRRAALPRREPESLARWAQRDLQQARAGDPHRRPPFVLHDGPPYANGPVHLGHVLNKCLKDFVVRSRSMDGRPSPLVFGWDCHGLPVERAVLEDDPARAGADPLALRAACRATALHWQEAQRARFDRLLTLSDRAVYRTLDPAYEAATLEVLASLVDRDVVFRARRPVRWSLGNHTALAEAELEYVEAEDPSVWVDFEAREPAALRAAFGLTSSMPGDASVALTAWTTTPWTLVANVALAVHPDHTYALVEGGGLRVVAADAVPRLEAALGQAVRVVATTPGAAMLGMRYAPVLGMRAAAHRVVAGPHVSAAEGSGVVHTAPGHGPEDHAVGVAEGLPTFSPVGPDGCYDDTVPEALRGMSVLEADPPVLAMLEAEGRLAARHTVHHAVAVDWRGGARVVYRATPQWFVALDRPFDGGATLRERALEALDGVRFVPTGSRRRLEGMLTGRPDWCVSRQRAWGLPLPAFFDPSEDALLTGDSVRAVARVVRAEGSDAWFRCTPSHLLGRPAGTLRKGGDVLDVWFESGASWAAVLGRRADLYLEGSDQHRGWFQASLLLSVAAAGQAPYRTVLTHGFVVDRDGRKLSKSAGNAPDVDALVARHGAEVLRWWAATSRYEADVKADEGLFADAGRAFRKVRDTLRFMVANLGDLPPDEVLQPAPAPLAPEAWVLGELDALVEEVRAAYEAFAFAVAARALLRFCADTLSARYLDAMKDRLYCDRADSVRRRRAQRTLHHVVEVSTRLLAPLLPHTADELWRALHRCEDDPVATVHALRFPSPLGRPVDLGWAALQEVAAAARMALEGTGAPLDKALVLPDPRGLLARLDPEDMAAWCGVSRVSLDAGDEVRVVDLGDQPRCERSRRRDATVRERAGGAWLSDRDADALASDATGPG